MTEQEQLEFIEETRKLQELDLTLKMLEGKPIPISDIGYIKQFTLSEINKLGYIKYNYYVGVICADLEGIEENKMYEWYFMQCVNNTDYKMPFLGALALFFDDEISFDENGFYVGNAKNKKIIKNEDLMFIRLVIKKSNCIQNKREEKPKFANKKAEEMWNQVRENERKLQKILSNKSNLSSLISGVAWKSGIHQNVWNLTLYQLFDAINRLNLIDSVDNTLDGIYAGTVDGKSVKKEELDWTKNIKSSDNNED